MRLTNELRTKIIRSLIVDTMQAEYNRICNDSAKFAEEVYNLEIPEFIRDCREQGWFPIANKMYVYSRVEHDYLHMNGEFIIYHTEPTLNRERIQWLKDPPNVSRQVPHKHYSDFRVSFSGELADRYEIIRDRRRVEQGQRGYPQGQNDRRELHHDRATVGCMA